MKNKRFILFIIIIAQFCCTSLWFAGNAIIGDLIINFNLNEASFGYISSSVQFGFIIGTLSFAILSIADLFSPSKIFFVCALIGALCNLGIIYPDHQLISLLGLRFFTGFFLAGIYPIGMKIATDYFQKGLGKSLGFLVGALVLGTAFPHLLKSFTTALPWNYVIITTSSLAMLGGILVYFLVPDGPFRTAASKLDLSASFSVFKNTQFKSAAIGYFGHMWELYAFWTFVPFILTHYGTTHHITLNTPTLSFLIIGIGSLGCILSGYISQKKGVKTTAFIALSLSCLCCLISPILFTNNNEFLYIGFLLFWGIVVIADSPLFSTLVSNNANPELKGTALTIVNCIGFSVTIISIECLNYLKDSIHPQYLFIVLALGPIVGLLQLKFSKAVTK